MHPFALGLVNVVVAELQQIEAEALADIRAHVGKSVAARLNENPFVGGTSGDGHAAEFIGSIL